MFKTIHKIFYGLAWTMAVVGGALLTALVLMLCLSILGREASDVLHSAWMQESMPGVARSLLDAGVGPIFGDYEFLVAGLAVSVFCFLGWCQITAGHATVDVFTSGLSDNQRRWLQVFIEILFAGVLVLIAVQLYDGMNTLARRRSTTFLLQYPLWWNYAAALVPAVITAAIGVYVALVRVAEAVTKHSIISAAGADH
ncbi:TRAP transporter small permease [Pararhodobacter zhoushanensis]|uniref:TRAP transporter small permease n=1 Tax=Pararhodobacter zhoushanensis TaxID=2479545 RepID=UPI000F8F6D33|nr:TRAP transporter small permease [Pararhodobacter zhoushanensis]